MDVLTVFLVATATALATGLGALPFLLFKEMTPTWVGVSNALAAGFMVGASAGLFYEGGLASTPRTVLGALLGALFVVGSRRVLGGTEDLHVGTLRGAGARSAVMILAVMTIHSFTEGVGVGVSFGGGRDLGVLIALAIAIHNIPEGLAISLTLVPRGTSVRSAAAWSVLSSLPQPLTAVPAYLGVQQFEPVLPVGLGFAGGAMLWLVASQIVPDARSTASDGVVGAVAAAGILVMTALSAVLVL
ncbi:MAG: ZIP family metal transporter [Gaiellales bacterium]